MTGDGFKRPEVKVIKGRPCQALPSYVYDANGNRTSKTLNGVTESCSYDAADKMTAAGAKSYSYDAAGRTTSVTVGGNTTTLAYDYENRITTITYPDSSTNTFTYNGLDTRVGKVDSAGTKTFRRDGVGVTDPVLSDGAADYTPGISERRSGTSKFYHSDHLGSNTLVTNSSQATTDTRTYDAFGLLTASTGSTPTPFGFAGDHGYQEDADSGLKLLGHRYYDPSTGRFLTRDPVKDGRNWYAYCAGRPAKFVDADGLKIRLIGFTAAQARKVRQQIHLIGSSPDGRQLVYDLINDHLDHIISPPNKPGDPHFDPKTGRIRYDPNESIVAPGLGPGGDPLHFPPDVILAHELGHMYGKEDPAPGAKPMPGDNVYDVENPYRKWRHLPMRMIY